MHAEIQLLVKNSQKGESLVSSAPIAQQNPDTPALAPHPTAAADLARRLRIISASARARPTTRQRYSTSEARCQDGAYYGLLRAPGCLFVKHPATAPPVPPLPVPPVVPAAALGPAHRPNQPEKGERLLERKVYFNSSGGHPDGSRNRLLDFCRSLTHKKAFQQSP